MADAASATSTRLELPEQRDMHRRETKEIALAASTGASARLPEEIFGEEQNTRSAESTQRMSTLKELSPYQGLSRLQRNMITRIDAVLDQDNDSVVITDSLAERGPIVYVTRCWENMCGYSLTEAVGQNPRITQGERTSGVAIRSISHAVRNQRAAKIRLVNYRGGAQCQPFWNCLNLHPIFMNGVAQLFVASLQDYSHRMDRLVTITPMQFCADGCHLQNTIRVSALADARIFKRPCRIEFQHDADDAQGASKLVAGDGSGGGGAIGGAPLPSPRVKRLGLVGLELESEYLYDRLRDELQQLQLPCIASEMVQGGAELWRIETFYRPEQRIDGGLSLCAGTKRPSLDTSAAEDCEPRAGSSAGSSDGSLAVVPATPPAGVRVVIHVMPEDAYGHHSISLTRLEGDTFAYHALFRLLKARLAL